MASMFALVFLVAAVAAADPVGYKCGWHNIWSDQDGNLQEQKDGCVDEEMMCQQDATCSQAYGHWTAQSFPVDQEYDARMQFDDYCNATVNNPVGAGCGPVFTALTDCCKNYHGGSSLYTLYDPCLSLAADTCFDSSNPPGYCSYQVFSNHRGHFQETCSKCQYGGGKRDDGMGNITFHCNPSNNDPQSDWRTFCDSGSIPAEDADKDCGYNCNDGWPYTLTECFEKGPRCAWLADDTYCSNPAYLKCGRCQDWTTSYNSSDFPQNPMTCNIVRDANGFWSQGAWYCPGDAALPPADERQSCDTDCEVRACQSEAAACAADTDCQTMMNELDGSDSGLSQCFNAATAGCSLFTPLATCYVATRLGGACDCGVDTGGSGQCEAQCSAHLIACWSDADCLAVISTLGDEDFLPAQKQQVDMANNTLLDDVWTCWLACEQANDCVWGNCFDAIDDCFLDATCFPALQTVMSIEDTYGKRSPAEFAALANHLVCDANPAVCAAGGLFDTAMTCTMGCLEAEHDQYHEIQLLGLGQGVPDTDVWGSGDLADGLGQDRPAAGGTAARQVEIQLLGLGQGVPDTASGERDGALAADLLALGATFDSVDTEETRGYTPDAKSCMLNPNGVGFGPGCPLYASNKEAFYGSFFMAPYRGGCVGITNAHVAGLCQVPALYTFNPYMPGNVVGWSTNIIFDGVVDGAIITFDNQKTVLADLTPDQIPSYYESFSAFLNVTRIVFSNTLEPAIGSSVYFYGASSGFREAIIVDEVTVWLNDSCAGRTSFPNVYKVVSPDKRPPCKRGDSGSVSLSQTFVEGDALAAGVVFGIAKDEATSCYIIKMRQFIEVFNLTEGVYGPGGDLVHNRAWTLLDWMVLILVLVLLMMLVLIALYRWKRRVFIKVVRFLFKFGHGVCCFPCLLRDWFTKYYQSCKRAWRRRRHRRRLADRGREEPSVKPSEMAKFRQTYKDVTTTLLLAEADDPLRED